MRTLRSTIAQLGLLIALAAPTAAQAELRGAFGVAVYDANDDLVRTAWRDETIMLGSDEECDLVVPDLAPAHVRFTLVEGKVVAIPLGGQIQVDGEMVADLYELPADARVTVGAYRLQFFVSTGAPDEGMEGSDIDPSDAARAAIDARATEFAKKAYRFCHDEKFGEDGVAGADFCVIFDEASAAVCPGARRCKDWKAAETEWRFGQAADGTSSGRAARRLQRKKPLLDLPELPPFVGWLLLGGLAFVVVAIFARAITKAGWEDDELDLSAAEISDAARQLQALPDTRSQVLLRMAARALQEFGDAHEAAILVHLAILRHLDDEGLARYHPSKTNGDYLRAIRRRKDLAELFKSVVRQTERIRFGDGQIDVEAIQRALDETGPVLGRNRAGTEPAPLVGLGLALIVLGASACGEAPGAQAYYNHGPAGMSALAPLLRATGLDVEVRRDRLIDLPADTGLIVLRTSAVGAGVWPKEFKLDSQLDMGRTVLVIDDLGKSSELLPSTASVAATKPPKRSELVLDIDPDQLSCAAPLHHLAERTAKAPLHLPAGRLVLWDGVSQTSTISTHPLVMRPFLRDRDRFDVHGRTAAHGWAVHRVEGAEDLPGCLFVFADRDLFTNASLTLPRNAAFVAQLFAALVPDGSKVVFADRLDQWTTSDTNNPFAGMGGDGTNPGQALEASNMLPFLLQAILTLALLYIALGAAFGPLRDPKTRTHKAFVEHVEAIGRQYHRTGQPGLTHSATSLARFLVLRYRDRLRGGETGGWSALAKELADRHDLDEVHVQAALRLGIEGKSELGAPAPEDPLPSSPQMLQTLSRLLSAQHRQLDTTAAPARRRPKTNQE